MEPYTLFGVHTPVSWLRVHSHLAPAHPALGPSRNLPGIMPPKVGDWWGYRFDIGKPGDRYIGQKGGVWEYRMLAIEGSKAV